MEKAHTRIFARMAFYLLFALGGLYVAGLLPYRWASSLVSAVFMLLPLLLERLAFGGVAPVSLSVKGASVVLLFSPLAVLTVSMTALLSALALQAVGLPVLVPSVRLDAAGLFAAVLVAPIAEELLCRHLLLGLCRRLSPRGGGCILLSAVLFALLHANLYQIPYALAAGLLLGAAAFLTDSCLLPILLHMGINLLSLLSTLPLLAGILHLALPVCAVVGLAVAYKRTSKAHYAPLLTAWEDRAGRRALLRGAACSPLTAAALLFLGLAVWRML